MNKWITKPKEKIYCEKCDKLVEYDIKEEKSIYNIRGQEIAINAYFVFCKECGEKLLEPYYEDLNLKKAYKKYINLNNYITAQEIKNIRKIYGVNQVIFAKLLGLGEATIQRYERNSIPTKVNSDLIKRVQDPEEFKKFLDLNKNSISDSDYEKINKKLQNIIQIPDENFESIKLEEILKKYQPNLKIEKLEGIIAEIYKLIYRLYKREFLYKTNFLKLLWFIETESKNEIGKQISGLQFIHYYYGPIPKNAKNSGILLPYLESKGIIDIETEYDDYHFTEKNKIKVKDITVEKYLDKKEKEVILKVIQKYGNKKAKELSDLTHKDKRYLKTKDDEVIPI